jgi:hypothetical protein
MGKHRRWFSYPYHQCPHPFRSRPSSLMSWKYNTIIPQACAVVKNGVYCLVVASQKRYMSFYLLNGEIVENNRHLLKDLSVGKGCIRFQDMKILSEATLRTLLREAAAANEASPNDHC